MRPHSVPPHCFRQATIRSFQESIAQSKERVKKWTKNDWAKSGAAFDAIGKDLVKVMSEGRSAGSPEAQAIIRRHFQWLQQFWTPTRISYAGHGELIVSSDLRQAYEAYHPRLAEFAAAGMKVFAERELS